MSYGVDGAAHVETFFFALGTGFLAGILWELLKAFRRRYAAPVVVFIEDFLFFLLLGVGTFLLAYETNFGRVRLYMLLGESIGFLVWYFLPGKLFRGRFSQHNFCIRVKRGAHTQSRSVHK